MDFFFIVFGFLIVFLLGVAAALFVGRVSPAKRKPKPKPKATAPWLTRRQLKVLKKIADTGANGILIWHTDINVATMRSLCKRGFADTASRGRLIATKAGKSRLRQPWPPESVQGDHKQEAGSSVSDVDQLRGQGDAEEA